MSHIHCCDEVDADSVERAAMLRLLGELEVGFANNPKHHEAVIARVREAIEGGQPLPAEAFAVRVRSR